MRLGVPSYYLYVPVFERKKNSNGNDAFADNSAGWHLATNSFHQHVRTCSWRYRHILFF